MQKNGVVEGVESGNCEKRIASGAGATCKILYRSNSYNLLVLGIILHYTKVKSEPLKVTYCLRICLLKTSSELKIKSTFQGYAYECKKYNISIAAA